MHCRAGGSAFGGVVGGPRAPQRSVDSVCGRGNIRAEIAPARIVGGRCGQYRRPRIRFARHPIRTGLRADVRQQPLKLSTSTVSASVGSHPSAANAPSSSSCALHALMASTSTMAPTGPVAVSSCRPNPLTDAPQSLLLHQPNRSTHARRTSRSRLARLLSR